MIIPRRSHETLGVGRPNSWSINHRGTKAAVTDIGIVFKNHLLLDWRTTLENVWMQAKPAGLIGGALKICAAVS